jgi:hypothetical protein
LQSRPGEMARLKAVAVARQAQEGRGAKVLGLPAQ